MKIHSSESKYVGDSRRSVVLEKIMPCLLFAIIGGIVGGSRAEHDKNGIWGMLPSVNLAAGYSKSDSVKTKIEKMFLNAALLPICGYEKPDGTDG